jgi:ABC-type sugar transport system substrate-binding protein
MREVLIRSRSAAALIALGAALLAGCGRGAPPASARPRVALVLKTLNNPFFIDMQKGAQEAATRLGVELVVQAAERETDVDKQMQIIENLIQTRVSALCITPSGSREIAHRGANAAASPGALDAGDGAATAEANRASPWARHEVAASIS